MQLALANFFIFGVRAALMNRCSTFEGGGGGGRGGGGGGGRRGVGVGGGERGEGGGGRRELLDSRDDQKEQSSLHVLQRKEANQLSRSIGASVFKLDYRPPTLKP